MYTHLASFLYELGIPSSRGILGLFKTHHLPPFTYKCSTKNCCLNTKKHPIWVSE